MDNHEPSFPFGAPYVIHADIDEPNNEIPESIVEQFLRVTEESASRDDTSKHRTGPYCTVDMDDYADEIDWIIAQFPVEHAAVSCETKMWHFCCTEAEWYAVQSIFAEIGVTFGTDDLLVDVAMRVREARS